MYWLADECVAAPLVEFLRGLGHDVLYVAESASGLRDTDVIELASIETRILLTEDKDFGDLVFRRERKIPGVVLISIAPENPKLKMMQLAAVIERYGEGLLGRYIVIEEGRFRVRPLWRWMQPIGQHDRHVAESEKRHNGCVSSQMKYGNATISSVAENVV